MLPLMTFMTSCGTISLNDIFHRKPVVISDYCQNAFIFHPTEEQAKFLKGSTLLLDIAVANQTYKALCPNEVTK